MIAPDRTVTPSALGRAATRDTEFDDVLRDLAVDLLGYFSRRLAEPADAADAVTETLIVLWRRQSDVPERRDDLRRYAFGIARKVLSRFERGHARRLALASRLRDEVATRTASDEVSDSDLDLRAALQTLPPQGPRARAARGLGGLLRR